MKKATHRLLPSITINQGCKILQAVNKDERSKLGWVLIRAFENTLDKAGAAAEDAIRKKLTRERITSSSETEQNKFRRKKK